MNPDQKAAVSPLAAQKLQTSMSPQILQCYANGYLHQYRKLDFIAIWQMMMSDGVLKPWVTPELLQRVYCKSEKSDCIAVQELLALGVDQQSQIIFKVRLHGMGPEGYATLGFFRHILAVRHLMSDDCLAQIGGLIKRMNAHNAITHLRVLKEADKELYARLMILGSQSVLQSQQKNVAQSPSVDEKGASTTTPQTYTSELIEKTRDVFQSQIQQLIIQQAVFQQKASQAASPLETLTKFVDVDRVTTHVIQILQNCEEQLKCIQQ